MKVLLVLDETAGPMVFKNLEAFAKDCHERGLDQGSDYKTMMENLFRGESFADKTTSFQWIEARE